MAEKGKGNPYRCAKNHLREDFADSVALYVINQDKFKEDFPNRFNFMEKWLKGGLI